MRLLAGLIVAGTLLVAASSASAAAGSGTWSDPSNDAGYNSPDVTAVAAVWDGDMLGFEVRVTQTGIYSGDRFSVQIDADRDGTGDYLLMLDCCEISRWMGSWTGSGWNIDTPQTTFRATYDRGTLQAFVHRAEVGSPQGTLHFRVQTAWAGVAGSYDLTPDAGWYVLPQETAAAGASGSDDAPAPAPAPVPLPQPAKLPAAPAAPAVPAVDLASTRAAVRALVRRRLGRRARVTRLSCRTDARCRLVARAGGWRYQGTATVRVTRAGAHRATFTGRRSRLRCPRGCRSPAVRWG